MRAVSVASRQVVTIDPQATPQAAAQLMAAHDIGALPVLDGERLVGLLSESDLLPGLRPDPRLHLRVTETERSAPRTVAELMSEDVVALPVDVDLAEAARVMLTQRVRHIPLVQGDRVLGILSRRDVLRALARTDEEIRRDVEAQLAEGVDVWGHLDVVVDQGRVRLTPREAPHRAELARRAVSGLPGVVEVSVEESPTPP